MKKIIFFNESVSGTPVGIEDLQQSDFSFVLESNHSTVVDFDHFDELGEGYYEFGDFDIADVSLDTGTGQWTSAVKKLLVRINGVIQTNCEEVDAYNDSCSAVASQDLFVRVDRLGDTIYNWLTYDRSLSGINGFNPFSPPQDSFYRFRIPSIGWCLDNFSQASSASLTSYVTLFGAAQTITSKKFFYGGTNFDVGSSGSTAGAFRVTTASNPVNGGITILEGGYTNDNTGFWDFKNSKVLFNGAVTGTSNWTLAGATFSNGVTFNNTVTLNTATVNAVATKLNGTNLTADLRKVTASAMTVSGGTLTIFNNLALTHAGEHFKYSFRNTDNDVVDVFSLGCDDGENAYIDFKNRQILNFSLNNSSISSSLSAYMPLTGGVFSGSVTANGPRLKIGNTAIEATSASAYLRLISASAISTQSITAGSAEVNLSQLKTPIELISATGQTLGKYASTVVCLGDGINPFQVLLPNSPEHGKTITIKHGDNSLGGTLTIDGNGRNIDDTSPITINSIYGSVTVQYNIIGDGWWILSRHLS